MRSLYTIGAHPAQGLALRRRVRVIAEALPPRNEAEQHSRSVEAAAAATFASTWWGSVPTPLTRISEQTASKIESTITLKDSLVDMQSYQMFLRALDKKAFLHDDWLCITSRPFVQGCVDALLSSPSLNHLLQTDSEIKHDVEAIVANLDVALRRGHGLSWMVGLFAALAHFPGIYALVEVADRALDNEKISHFEAEVDHHIASTPLAELHREVHLVKRLLSPVVLDLMLRFASSIITTEFVIWVATLMDAQVTQSDLLTSLSQDPRRSACRHDGTAAQNMHDSTSS